MAYRKSSIKPRGLTVKPLLIPPGAYRKCSIKSPVAEAAFKSPLSLEVTNLAPFLVFLLTKAHNDTLPKPEKNEREFGRIQKCGLVLHLASTFKFFQTPLSVCIRFNM